MQPCSRAAVHPCRLALCSLPVPFQACPRPRGSATGWSAAQNGLDAGTAGWCKHSWARSQFTAHDCAFGLPDGCHFHHFWGNLVQNTGVADHPRIQRQFRTGEFSRPRKFAKSALVGRKGVESGRPKAQSTMPFDVSVRSWGWCQMSLYRGLKSPPNSEPKAQLHVCNTRATPWCECS